MSRESEHYTNHSDYPLPLVTKELIDSTTADGSEMGLKEFLKTAGARLEHDNPVLKKNLTGFILNTFMDENERAAAFAGVAMTYELLHRQAEAVSMQSEFDMPVWQED